MSTPAAGTTGPAPSPVRTAELLTHVQRVARRLTGDFEAEDVLHELVRAAVGVLGADGAAVVVPGEEGLLRLASATAGAVTEVEAVQELLREGPCWDAHRRGRVVLSADLAVEGDWPSYQRRATELGVHGVCALPMSGRGAPLGVLTVYHRAPHRWSGAELGAAGAFADLAACCLAVARDREETRSAREELAYRVEHDALTGLPVRAVFLQELARALRELPRHRLLGVLFVDLDGLKRTNDTHGHLAGDQLIRASARRLRRAVRPGDVVARVGGDEFLVLLRELRSAGEAAAVAARVVREFAAPAELDDVAVQPSASVGVAVTGTADPADADALVSRADAAMYGAKRSGPGRWAVFDPEAHAGAAGRGDRGTELRRALRSGGLQVHYEPVVDVDAGRAVAVEALVRWPHPQRGLLVAEEFLHAADDPELLAELGSWVLRSACAQLAAWDGELGGRAPERVLVDVSALGTGEPRLEREVLDALAAHGLAPGRLVLGTTEREVLDDPRTSGTLARLHEHGCVIAVDDFGTGHSSLSRLVHLPVGVLKVDRSFTGAVLADAAATAVVATVLRLGESLGCQVVVEGVEDRDTLAALTALGCRYAQGPHLGRPAPAHELRALLAR
ncbi:putative bifunctional diguanylate cyclase/phosphodiesterase [Kineococcus sp. SYSU DK005]|uniref:putative bifunctional diguanylate cyclase/phosphodiesterase n=1 Tax=Kineococcus sp. SYSU DK005 TaxID=3383126 RepID=UPI003D7CA693